MIQLPLNSQNKNLKQTSTIQLSESKTTFSKKEVLQLIDEIKAEAEKSIDDAFNEGYKAATVFYKPKLQGYEIQLEKLKHELMHCVLAHHGELEFGSPKKPALVEALALSMADNLDAKLETMTELFNGTEEKGWLGFQKLFESNVRKTSES